LRSRSVEEGRIPAMIRREEKVKGGSITKENLKEHRREKCQVRGRSFLKTEGKDSIEGGDDKTVYGFPAKKKAKEDRDERQLTAGQKGGESKESVGRVIPGRAWID